MPKEQFKVKKRPFLSKTGHFRRVAERSSESIRPLVTQPFTKSVRRKQASAESWRAPRAGERRELASAEAVLLTIENRGSRDD